MIFIRSKKVQKEYDKIIPTISSESCFICNKELIEYEFKYWLLLKNRFPYCIKFLFFEIPLKNHYLLSPKRHINDRKKLSIVEYAEFKYLIEVGLEKKGYSYDIEKLNTKEESSFKYHLHYQIIEYKLYYKLIDAIIKL